MSVLIIESRYPMDCGYFSQLVLNLLYCYTEIVILIINFDSYQVILFPLTIIFNLNINCYFYLNVKNHKDIDYNGSTIF